MNAAVGTFAFDFDNENNLWFSNAFYNGLVKCDLQTGKIIYIKKFVKFAIENSYLHCAAKCYKGKVFFFPRKSEFISVIDKTTYEEINLEIPKKSKFGYYGIVTCNENECILMPSSLEDEAWIINLETYRIEPCEKINELFRGLQIKNANTVSFCTYENDVIFTLVEQRKIVKYNIISFQKECVDIGKFGDVYRVFYNENLYWITFFNRDDIIVINKHGEVVNTYKNTNIKYIIERNIIPYSNIYFGDEFIVLANYYAESCVTIKDNVLTTEREYSDYERDYKGALGYGSMYSEVLEYKNKVYYIPERANYLIEYNPKMKKKRFIKFEITDYENLEDKNEIDNALLRYQNEGAWNYALESWLKLICFDTNISKNRRKSHCVGNLIYDSLK